MYYGRNPLKRFIRLGDWNTTYTIPGNSLADEPSFTPTDRRISKNKVRDAFKRCPYQINVVMINHPLFSRYFVPGKVTQEQVEEYLHEYVIWEDPEAITCILVSNIGAARVALTPWMVAHRISHGLVEDQTNVIYPLPQYGRARISDRTGVESVMYLPFRRLFEKVYEMYASVIDSMERPIVARRTENMESCFCISIAQRLGTMLSAKNNNIFQPAEFVHELLAQYIVKGRIRLRFLSAGDSFRFDYSTTDRFPADFSQDGLLLSYTLVRDPEIPRFQREITEAIENLLRSAVGGLFIA